ncbi:MAG: alpha/beta hydrolase [Pseudomonadota bacterium]
MRQRQSTTLGTSSLLLAVTLTCAACSSIRTLMPTPLVYGLGNVTAFEALDPALTSNTVEVLYATDRAPTKDPETGQPRYSFERDPSFAIGVADVLLGPDLSWAELETDVQTGNRRQNIPLTLASVREIARTPPGPYPYELVNGQFVLPESLQRRIDEDFKTGGKYLLQALARTKRKEAFIYVHGVGNSFEDALFVGAEFWHYLGREGLPVVYTWPAGHPGFGGYGYDRESSEFTISHFREFLLGLASFKEIERIHIIAHSRGTDVVTTALRELFAETRAAGLNPSEVFRIGNLVLAAPDLDFSVVQQRSTRISYDVERMTIYTSKRDKAIGIASWLFDSGLRVGGVGLDDLTPEMRAALARQENIAMVQYVGAKGGDYGHNYFRLNPSVASDLVLLLRYDLAPGIENGRPLRPRVPGFWEIDDDYLVPAATDRAGTRPN